jgi:hypothetical protein
MCYIFLINTVQCNLPNRIYFINFKLNFEFVWILQDLLKFLIESELQTEID